MAINLNESFQLEEFGVSFANEQGEVQLYLTGGSGSPLGNVAPIETIYFNKDDRSLWRKTGAGVNDWSKLEWDRNYSYKTIVEPISIPDNQEMISTGICLESSGCVSISDKSSLTVIKEG